MKRAWKNFVVVALLGVGAVGCAEDPSVDDGTVESDEESEDFESLAAEEPSPWTPWWRRDGGLSWPFPRRDAGGPTPTVDAGTPEVDAGGPSTGGSLPKVTSVEVNGPFPVTIEQNVGPNRGWVVRPTNLGQNGIKHPVFTWGAGAGTNASNYRDHLTRIASHGFVVEAHASNGNGSDHKGAIDWLVAQNNNRNSPYYQKLDITKIASGGHSQGSISTFAMADDPRLSTTIHVAGGSFDGNGYRKLRNPAAMFLGQNDTLATPNGERDYQRSTVPTFMTVMSGVDHISAARQALGPTVAWLRWHLAGETERKAQFVGANCEYCRGKYRSQSKGL